MYLFICFILFFFISTASGAEDNKLYYTLADGYRLVKTNYTWAVHLLDTNTKSRDLPDKPGGIGQVLVKGW